MSKFTGKTSFYLKSLLLYGGLFALFHCTNMHYDQKHDSTAVQLTGCDESTVRLFGETREQQEKIRYPSAQLWSLMGQCRNLKTEYRRQTACYEQCGCGSIGSFKALADKARRLVRGLKKERGRFFDYIARNRFRNTGMNKGNFLCLTGRCKFSDVSSRSFAHKKRRDRSERYTCQVMNHYIECMEMIVERLDIFVEKIRLHDEATKARSENVARQLAELKVLR